MANRLAAEKSPYLLQHAHNPVDWYPWGEEALARAKTEDKPILLSVGYSACHWCHVMERESFEDPSTAELMNRHFVNIKVDREERPDIDNIYQSAVQLQRRSGGWPLTAFLTPDGRPFLTGTYFPDQPRHNLPSFSQLLAHVERVWREQRPEVERSAGAIRDALAELFSGGEVGDLPGEEELRAGAAFLRDRVDPIHGGFRGAPKFPSPTNLWTLWRHAERTEDARFSEAVLLTLRKMAAGGVYDHLAGGFHRYSTDEEWLVPHFEKMLYDNALLVPLYVAAWRRTRDPGLLAVATDVLDYLLREMWSPEGLFYAATDADAEGEEGRSFVWSLEQLVDVLGEDAEKAAWAWDVSPSGNWEGKNILRRKMPWSELERRTGLQGEALRAELERLRLRLRAARDQRVQPLRDDKHLVSWNALTVIALAEGYLATGDPRYRQAAIRTVDSILRLLVTTEESGLCRLQHSRCGGQVKGPGLLDDHGAFGEALLRVAELTGERRYVDAAFAVALELEGYFWGEGGWYQTPRGAENLVLRPRDDHDSAVPSGTGLACSFLLRLSAHSGESRYRQLVHDCLSLHAERLGSNPYGAGSLLSVLDSDRFGWEEVVLGGEGTEALERVAAEAPGLDRLILRLEGLPPEHPARAGRRAERPTAWVCRGQTCSLPVHSPEALAELLGRA
jgi:uncharacterized protein